MRRHVALVPFSLEYKRNVFPNLFSSTARSIALPGNFWTVEGGEKQTWYISRKTNELIFIAGLTNFRPDTKQEVEGVFVI
jgi:putative SOS response-associated peptidase YedK